MSTIQGKGRGRAKGKAKVMGSRKLKSMAKAKGHPIPSGPSYLDMCKVIKALSDDSLMLELFKDWMRDFDRRYPTKEEEEKRFWVFKDHVQELLEHFKQGTPWGMNGFADMSGDELVATYIGKGMAPYTDSDSDTISESVTSTSTCPTKQDLSI